MILICGRAVKSAMRPIKFNIKKINNLIVELSTLHLINMAKHHWAISSPYPTNFFSPKNKILTVKWEFKKSPKENCNTLTRLCFNG